VEGEEVKSDSSKDNEGAFWAFTEVVKIDNTGSLGHLSLERLVQWHSENY
jgi:hypothetical protein